MLRCLLLRKLEASASLPGTGSELFVMLSKAERLTHPISTSNNEQVQFTRVEESFALHVEATASDDGIVLARLVRKASGWKVDDAFLPLRARRDI